MTKKYDLAVKVGEYTNSQGEKKNRYMNVGAVMQGDKGPYLLLDRTFNPAGVPGNEGKSSVLISCFAPDGKRADKADTHSRPADAGFEDDIPF